jgi:hypothetical protein
MPVHVVQSFLQLALQADAEDTSGKVQKTAKDFEQQDQIWELLKVLISALLDQCPKMKYDVFLIISQNVVTGKTPVRQSFLQGVLQQMKQSEQAKKLESFAPPPRAAAIEDAEEVPRMDSKTDSRARDGQPVAHKKKERERTVMLAKVECFSTDKRWIQASNPSSQNPFLALVVTTKAIMVIDASVDGYPEKPTILHETHRDVTEMTRIVKGATNQVVHIGLARSGHWEDGEEFITVICHRETERNGLLSALRAQSIPRGAPQFFKVPLFPDSVFKKALEDTSVQPPFLMATYLMCEDRGEKSLKLLVLLEGSLYVIKSNFEKWMPPDIAISEEIGSDSGGEDSGGEDGGMKTEVGANSKKKAEDEQMLGAIFAGGGANDPARVEAENLHKNRQKARAKGTGQKMEDALKGESEDGLLSVTNTIRIDNLEKVAFYPDFPPRMALTYEDENPDSAARMFGVSTERMVLIFFDEFTKEAWKRHVISLLQKKTGEASKWEPRFKSAGEGDRN